MLSPTGQELSAVESLRMWPQHLANVALQDESAFDEELRTHVAHRVEHFAREVNVGEGSLDHQFCEGELLAARSAIQSNSAPGEDGIPYRPLLVDWHDWNTALLAFYNLVLLMGSSTSVLEAWHHCPDTETR